MKNRMKKAMVLFLAFALCMGLVGCRFVVKETQVLMNPQEQIEDSSQTETPGEDEGVKEETSSPQDNASSDDKTDKTDKPSNSDQTTNKPSTSVANVEPKLSGTLELQIWTNENEDVANAWTDVIDDFEAATGVKVTAYIGSQANTRMTKRWMGNNPPDVALLAGSGIPDVALEQAGGLYDMTDVIKSGYVYGTNDKIWDVIETNYYPKATDSVRYYRPKLYASTNGILWDQTYLKELGMKAPTNYTELKKFATTAKEKGIATFTTYGTAGHYAVNSMIMPAIAAYGTSVFDACSKGLASGWNSKEVKQVFQRWYDFCRMEGALLKGTSSFDHTTSQMKWLNHEALLIGNGQWLPYEVENNTPSNFQMELATSPLITESQKPTIVMGAGSMIVAKEAKNLENAKAFIRFLYTKEAQASLAAAQGYVPIRKDMDYKQLDLMPSQKKIISYIYSGKAKIVYSRYGWGSLNEEINAAVHGLMTGNMNVDQAVKHILTRAK